jgi:hypothetical protein
VGRPERDIGGVNSGSEGLKVQFGTQKNDEDTMPCHFYWFSKSTYHRCFS